MQLITRSSNFSEETAVRIICKPLQLTCGNHSLGSFRSKAFKNNYRIMRYHGLCLKPRD